MYDYIKEKTMKVTEEVLETASKKEKKNHWITREIKDEILEKKAAYIKWFTTKTKENRKISPEKKRNLNHKIRSIKVNTGIGAEQM